VRNIVGLEAVPVVEASTSVGRFCCEARLVSSLYLLSTPSNCLIVAVIQGIGE
jgi:hypothetical protein